MPRPARISLDRLVDEAIHLVDSGGESALSLTALAARLEVKPPSLYNHIDSLEGVRYLLAVRGLTELVDRLRGAASGRDGREALRALAYAHRAFARERPGLYALTQTSYEGRDDTLQRIGREAVEVVAGVLNGYGIEGEDALHATRALRSALAGFTQLEGGAGFGLPLEIDRSYDYLIDLLDRGLRR
jgi:AcrR family transcriptional regulator